MLKLIALAFFIASAGLGQMVDTSPRLTSDGIFWRSGTYTQMSACTITICPAGTIWRLTDALTSGNCQQGSGVANTGFSFCGRDVNGAWLATTPATQGTGGGTGSGTGDTTTVYGGFTGGGSTVTVSDADCNTGDDTTAVQAKLTSLANNGTLDFQNTTEPCDINTAGLTRASMTNIRITSTVTAPAAGHLRQTATGLYTPAYSSMLYLSTCTNCLVDKLKINGNSKKGQGVFFHHGSGNSVQNTEIYNIAYDSGGTGPYAAVKVDDCTDCFVVGNNLHDFTGVNGGEGVRCVWAGVGSEESIRPRILNNTCTVTGHTGIVTESQGPVVTGNLVTSVPEQGTCFKFIPRGAEVDATFDNNTCDSTKDGGFQFEPSPDGVQPDNVFYRNNQCKNVGTLSGDAFGCFYISGSAGGGSYNLKITGNVITNSKAIANVNNAHNILFQNNTIISPNGADGNNINLENDNDNITAINSGNVNIHSPACDACSNIFEDGVQLAWLPRIDRNTVLAMLPWRRRYVAA
jgi:hypothetical protein